MPVADSRPPSGVVTFLFTDIGGSTRKWESDDRAMAAAVRRHDDILRSVIGAHGGYIFKTVGDAFCATFTRATDALRCAVAIQRTLAEEPWPIEDGIAVRIALHAGEEYEMRDGDYFGRSVNRVARLGTIAHPGQIIADAATFDLARSAVTARETVIDQGMHRLKDLDAPVHVKEVRRAEDVTVFPPLASLGSHESNLPIPARPIVGRAKLIERICREVERSSVVMLLGAGGIGKTRAAIEAATAATESFPDGSHFIDFSRETGADVLDVIRGALVPRGERIDLDRLVERVRDRKQLIVIDDGDEVRDECAAIVTRLAENAPQMRFITTSRQPLPVRSAASVRIGRLDPPDAERLLSDLLSAQGLAHVDRRMVRDLAEAADGIPLALEVIAGSAQTVPLEHVAAAFFGERVAVDDGGILDRAVKAGVDLLAERERIVFACAAVFAGGWTVDAMNAVAAAAGVSPSETLAALKKLASVSLIELEGSRYRIFAPVRAHAASLLDPALRDELRAAHAKHYAAFAARAVDELPRAADVQRRAIFAERPNLRYALATFIANGDRDAAVALSLHIVPIWQRYADFDDGLVLLTRVNDELGERLTCTQRAHVLTALTALAQFAGRREKAASYAQHALSHATDCGEPRVICEAEMAGANVSRYAGRTAEAAAAYAHCAEQFERLGVADGVARAKFNLASIYEATSEYTRASALFAEALAIFEREEDDHRVAWALYGLASVAVHQRDLTSARAYLAESLVLRRQIEDRRGIAECLLLEAQIAAETDPAGGLRILVEALEFAEQSGHRVGLAIGARTAADALMRAGRDDDAAVIFGIAYALAHDTGLVGLDAGDMTLGRVEITLAGRLGEGAIAAAKRRGARDRDHLVTRFAALMAEPAAAL
jgi:class 3 adenylate cyclase/predicted ATPase